MGAPNRDLSFFYVCQSNFHLLPHPKLADAVGANEGDIQEGSGYTTLQDPTDSGIKWCVISHFQQRLYCNYVDTTHLGGGNTTVGLNINIPSKFVVRSIIM